MAKIYNSDLTKELTDGAKIQTAFDKVPSEIAEKVVPVMEVNPKSLRTINKVYYRTSAGTMFTTSSTNDTYLLGYTMNASATAAGDNTINFTATVDGDSSSIIIAGLRLKCTAAVDADSGNCQLTFPYPIKLAKNTAVTISIGGTIATGTYTAFIQEVYNNKA